MVASLAREQKAFCLLSARLFHHAETNPSHDAVIGPGLKLSYTQLAGLVRAQAQRLHEAGISDQSVIGIRCADDEQHLVLCLAAVHVGAASVTVPSHETREIQEAIIERCDVSHVIGAELAVEPLSRGDGAGALPAGAPAARLLFATSGTTGQPKIVVLRDSDLVAQAHRHIGSQQERFACLATMEHNFAKRHRLYCVAEGATNIFLEADPKTLIAQCRSRDVNVMHLSAFQARELLSAPGIGGLADIRLKLGGSHVSATLRQQLRSSVTGNLQAGYGTTETGAIAFTDPDDPDAGESVGQALPGIEIRAVSPDGETLGPGEHGEFAIRCAGMFLEYLGDAAMTAAKLRGGWFYTGDVGYLDAQRRIHVCGRSDDMFVFNSMNIYPQDIESRIFQYPGIADAVVLPKESSVHGCIPIALVVFARGAKPKLPALKKFVSEQAGIRSPRQYIVVTGIPRNASGKIARREAATLSGNIDHHRKAIIRALDDRTRDQLPPSLIAAFENGDADIRLRDIAMDSLARMELLIALELEHGLIITPKEFSERGSLGKIAARLLSVQTQGAPRPDARLPDSAGGDPAPGTDKPPYVVRFFRRVFSYCHTVAQFNRALVTLEHRLTPTDVDLLHATHRDGRLIPPDAAGKFHTVFSLWIDKVVAMMRDSGKAEPEPFVSKRVAPAVTLFAGPGAPADKRLVVCFAIRGGRSLMMPNAVLMQHTDAARYDLLVVAEPLSGRYDLGVPLLGNNVTEVIEWLGRQELVRSYRAVRTLGSSAGAYPALIGGYMLGAEVAVSAGGRLHSWRHYGKILERMWITWRAVRGKSSTRALLCFGIDKTRDRNYARIMAWLSGGRLVAIRFSGGSVGHLLLERLIERGELAQYLERTVFADPDDTLMATGPEPVTMTFPGTDIRPAG